MNYKSIAVLVVLICLIFSIPVMAATKLTKIEDGKVTKMDDGTLAKVDHWQNTFPMEITAPVHGDAWPPSSKYKITWIYDEKRFNSDTVKILLLKGGKVAQTISAYNVIGMNGKGEAPPNNFDMVPPGNDYQIKIVGLDSHTKNETNQYAISAYFTILAERKVQITAPYNAQVFYLGENIPISWNYAGDIGKTLQLHLFNFKATPQIARDINLAAPTGNSGHGSYDWQIPNDLPTGSYQISIEGNDQYVYHAVSEFTIAKYKAVVITPGTIHIPKPGEKFELNPQPEPPEKIKH